MTRAIPLTTILFLCAFTVMLGGCSTMIEGESQEITIETPGAAESLCILKNYENNVKVVPPQTVRVMNSGEPLEIECLAAGNRVRRMTIPSITSPSVALNTFHGLLPGAYWDFTTGAAYYYPKKFEVDFVGIDPAPMPLPAYERLARQFPDHALEGMEEFRAGWPALQEDKYRSDPALKRIPLPSEGPFEEMSASGASAAPPAQPPRFSKSVGESLTQGMNPGVFDVPAPSGAAIDALSGDE